MKKNYTKEQKAQYFKTLRARWQAAKEYAIDNGEVIKAIMVNHGLNMSVYSFAFVQHQMQAQGLEGLPYLDVKTFQGWKENGFRVRKGEASTLSSIVWISSEKKEEEEGGYSFPKATALFHRSQVEEV